MHATPNVSNVYVTGRTMHFFLFRCVPLLLNTLFTFLFIVVCILSKEFNSIFSVRTILMHFFKVKCFFFRSFFGLEIVWLIEFSLSPREFFFVFFVIKHVSHATVELLHIEFAFHCTMYNLARQRITSEFILPVKSDLLRIANVHIVYLLHCLRFSSATILYQFQHDAIVILNVRCAEIMNFFAFDAKRARW